MLAAEHYPDLITNSALPRHELLEIHRSKISIHRAKAGYSYPTVRLPYAFSKLAGLSTRIYQTVHDGALAFLMVVSPIETASENAAERRKMPVLTWRRSPVRIRPSPSFFLTIERRSAFPTTQGATNYLNGVDKSDYRLSNRTDSKSEAYASQYYNATGYYAQAYQEWFSVGSVQTPSTGMGSITQWDNILEFTTMYIPTTA